MIGVESAPPAQGADDLEAVAVRQAKIEQHDRIGRGLDGAAGIFHEPHYVDGESASAQILRHEIGKLDLVFDKKNAHGCSETPHLHLGTGLWACAPGSPYGLGHTVTIP